MVRIFLICIVALLGAQVHAQSTTKHPNIVFIMADDLGYADVGFNGSTWYETPALDALAQESLVFDNAYMYPTCSPSRTALFTGKQSFRTGVYTVPVLEKGTAQENIFSRWTVPQEHKIYAQPLAEVGYQSIHLGKWHIVGPYPLEELNMEFPLKKKLTQPDPADFSWLDLHKSAAVRPYYPEGRGFLKNVGGTYRGDPALEEGGYKSDTGGYFAPFSNPFIEQKPDDEWLTDRLTDDAIEFMEQHQDEPFLINLHFYTVHRPTRARSQKLFNKYLNKPGDPNTGQGLGKNREEMAAYATMIKSMDDNIQRIVEYLDRTGLRDNTILFFTSDNGYNGIQSRNDQLRGCKGYIYEGGIRVPALVNWPGHIHARRSDLPITMLDYFPTFMDLAGIEEIQGTIDGDSLTTLFKQNTEKFKKRPLYWHLASQYKHGTCTAMRKGNFKLIQFLADGRLELYDLEEDPSESHNLAEERPELTQQLLSEMVEWRKVNNVPLPPNAVMPN
ncbi:putative sulfatase [Planctomycetales bacterium 10988]|nr:putative sulfatase [Planctomycetales bacterium 10988]